MAEAERELASITKAVGELEVRTLLARGVRRAGAVITIRPGPVVSTPLTSPTCSRMLCPLAERHGAP